MLVFETCRFKTQPAGDRAFTIKLDEKENKYISKNHGKRMSSGMADTPDHVAAEPGRMNSKC